VGRSPRGPLIRSALVALRLRSPSAKIPARSRSSGPVSSVRMSWRCLSRLSAPSLLHMVPHSLRLLWAVVWPLASARSDLASVKALLRGACRALPVSRSEGKIRAPVCRLSVHGSLTTMGWWLPWCLLAPLAADRAVAAVTIPASAEGFSPLAVFDSHGAFPWPLVLFALGQPEGRFST